MWNIDETRWYMGHFDPCPIEAEARRLTVEIFKTLAVILFGIAVIGVLG
jgi:hypothetical protein